MVFSASEDPDDIRTAYALGASSYLIKPAGFSELLELVKTLHTYWMRCSIPEVNGAGQQLHTENVGKLGERYPQSPTVPQRRVRPG